MIDWRGKTQGNQQLPLQKPTIALAGVAHWIDHGPVNQRVASSIPGQGTCLACGCGPQLGACEATTH